MNKIIYFDKETIQNILQEKNEGTMVKKTDISTDTQLNAEISLETKIDLGVPFIDRLRFLLTGNLAVSYMINRNSTTSISSTEISEFEKISKNLKPMKKVKILDIENSSTFFRVAAGYLKMMKNGVDGVDIKEFKMVMDSYEGYDTYKINDTMYVRFNNSAFVSNYKRNDLLTTEMTLYCIPVGSFYKSDFNFYKQILKMQKLISGIEPQQTLEDVFPVNSSLNKSSKKENVEKEVLDDEMKIELFDVLYACIQIGGK